MAINVDELPEQQRKALAGVADMVPDKLVVYGKILLLLGSLTVSEANWAVNKARRDLAKLSGKNEKEGKK